MDSYIEAGLCEVWGSVGASRVLITWERGRVSGNAGFLSRTSGFFFRHTRAEHPSSFFHISYAQLGRGIKA